jgi:hypothetical protein
MRSNFTRLFLSLLLMGPAFSSAAQKSSVGTVIKKHPESFAISKAELQDLLSKPANTAVKSRNNKYLDKGMVLKNVTNGDMHFLRVKLNYFSTAYLTVQVNGQYSTQVFILSENKSVFYKGKVEKGDVLMTKCAEDEIVSE